MHGDFLQQQYRRISNPRVRSLLLHSLFWLVWLGRNIYDVLGLWDLQWGLLYTGTIFLSQAPLVYLHLYLIVPRLLNRQKLPLYFLVTGVLVILSSWANYLMLRSLSHDGMPQTMVNFVER